MKVICNQCPRRCGAERDRERGLGVCACSSLPTVVRAAPHFGEEPCLTGTRGAGTIFFSGCNLKCVYCQNVEISRGRVGTPVTVADLRSMMLRLRDQGVHNIDLVTPTHFTSVIRDALTGLELGIPVVWNSSGYENVEELKTLEGLVQVYMPDYKYADSALAGKYSAAPDYPQVAAAAIKEMFRQVGAFCMDEDGLLQKGVLIRHLILPGCVDNSMDVIDFVADEFPRGSVLFSLMSQYTPMPGLDDFPQLQRRVTAEENDLLCHYMAQRHIETGYWQENAAATRDMIPDFDGTGVG